MEDILKNKKDLIKLLFEDRKYFQVKISSYFYLKKQRAREISKYNTEFYNLIIVFFFLKHCLLQNYL